MNLNVEETGPLERRLQVEIPTAEVDRAFDAFYRDLGRRAQLKGFRRGRAPRAILERRFGREARGEVFQTLVRDTLFQAIEQAELDIVGEPRLDSGDAPTQGAGFCYEATVEVCPEIRLAQVEGLKLAAVELPEPGADAVEAQLEELRDRWADLVEEGEGVAAAAGHVASVDFEGRVGGETFEGGSGTEVGFEIGSGRAPDFEQALVGLRVGDEKSFEVDFPQDHSTRAVAGRKVEVKVVLRGLKRKQLPALDDELAKDVSQCETIDELRAELARRLEEDRAAERRRLERERVVEALIAANPFPLPRSLVDAQIENIVQHMTRRAASPRSEEERAELAGRWREEARSPAERATARALLIPKIARSRGIEVGDDEVERRIAQIAELQGHDAARLRRAYRERKDGIERLRFSLLEEKVVEFLLSKSVFEGG